MRHLQHLPGRKEGPVGIFPLSRSYQDISYNIKASLFKPLQFMKITLLILLIIVHTSLAQEVE